MVRLVFGFLLPVVCILSSCSRQTKFLIYKDSDLPLTLQYVTNKMKVAAWSGNLGTLHPPLQDEKNPGRKINVYYDFSDEFPKEISRRSQIKLFDIYIYKTREGFREYCGGLAQPRSASPSWGVEEPLNNIPAILFKTEEGRPFIYIFTIPGIYAELRIEPGVALSAEEWKKQGSLEPLDRAYVRAWQVAEEIVSRVVWESPIDTSSEEFRIWKGHIWEILKKPRYR